MSIIKNKKELAINPLRKNALEILEAGLEAINTERILKNKLKLKNEVLNIDGHFLNLKSYNKILFIGIGKCASDGAVAVESILGDYLADGIALDVKSAPDLKKIKSFIGTHPLPSEQNIEATKKILEMTSDLSENDLVLCLISGGGSSLFEMPAEDFSLEDIIEKTKELTAKGADIYELNDARKKMSQVKGGKFVEHCSPAKVVSLIFSDVLGNDVSVIASGPTVIGEAAEKNSLRSQDATHISLQEFSQPLNLLLCSNRDALIAMKSKAEELGFKAKIKTETLSGNATEIGKELAEKNIEPKSCFLFGGETTVKIKDNRGEGGRNQELALSALLNIKNSSLIISVASDGWDNTEHAGAIADSELLEKSKQLGLSPQQFLERSDSHNFFKQVGGAISTGRLGSNVSDLCILIYK